MSQVSQFQKQVLSELGIITWKLRDDSEPLKSLDTTSNNLNSQTQQTGKSSGLSGLELIKQQMAKSGETKTPAPGANNESTSSARLKSADTTASDTTPESTKKLPEHSSQPAVKNEPIVAPAKVNPPVLQHKEAVLVWQSPGLPESDVVLALETLNIPFEQVASDSVPTHRFSLLISVDKPQKLTADKSLILNSAGSKKQLWKALVGFKRYLENNN